jgi:hypothetical protein
MQVSDTKSHAFIVEAAGTVAPTNVRYKVLTLLVALASLTYLDRLCISIAGPAITRELSLNEVAT